MSRAAPWMLLATGVLLILSGLAHAFLGWPALRAELSAARVPAELATGVAVGWLYGSGAMAGGAWVEVGQLAAAFLTCSWN